MKPGDIVPNGLYFNLPEEIYHADPDALGSTALKGLVVDPVEWQFDNLYEEDKDTEALIFGSALHLRMLEGRAAFERRFCEAYVPDLSGDVLVTKHDLTAWLKEHGQTGLSALRKDDLCRRVLELDPDQRIEEVERRTHAEETEGKTELKARRWGQINVACRWVQRDPLLSAVMEDGTFIEGAPEVSIFYEDNGVRLKARLDRMLRHAIVDLKSFAPWWRKRIQIQVVEVLERMNYDLQAAAYLRAWDHAKQAYADGTLAVFGDEPVPGFLDQAFDRDEPKWIWVMIKSRGAPQPLVVDWRAEIAKATAGREIDTAIETYRDLVAEFGRDQDWPPRHAALELFDTDLPTWWGTKR
ncbi:MAG: PD-(D/E)XK nuclease-like domain-containing protein [Roseibium sp.]|nr:PD-(D/E)XK nuclease-like domain-containing protein [Roseibium sp.]